MLQSPTTVRVMFIKSEESLSRILQSVGSGDLNMFRDVRIRCSGGGGGRSESVFCHQTILSSFSPFLASLLASSCSCKSDINIVLQDVDIQTVQVGSLFSVLRSDTNLPQALMGILYTGTLQVSGENMKSSVLSLAAMLGMDLSNFNIEEVASLERQSVPSYSVNGKSQFYGLKFSPSIAVANNGKKSEDVLAVENPPKKKRGRPRKVRTEEESETAQKRTKKPKKSSSAAGSERNTEDGSSPEIFYHVTNPTFTIKAGDKKALKKKTRKRKLPEVEPSTPVIPEISLTFDLGGDSADKTINLQQLAQPKRGRKKKSECQEKENHVKNTDPSTNENYKNEKITFSSPEEVLERIEAANEAARNYSSDEDALVMDLSVSTGSI